MGAVRKDNNKQARSGTNKSDIFVNTLEEILPQLFRKHVGNENILNIKGNNSIKIKAVTFKELKAAIKTYLNEKKTLV